MTITTTAPQIRVEQDDAPRVVGTRGSRTRWALAAGAGLVLVAGATAALVHHAADVPPAATTTAATSVVTGTDAYDSERPARPLLPAQYADGSRVHAPTTVATPVTPTALGTGHGRALVNP